MLMDVRGLLESLSATSSRAELSAYPAVPSQTACSPSTSRRGFHSLGYDESIYLGLVRYGVALDTCNSLKNGVQVSKHIRIHEPCATFQRCKVLHVMRRDHVIVCSSLSMLTMIGLWFIIPPCLGLRGNLCIVQTTTIKW